MIAQATMQDVKRVLVEQARTDTVGLWTVVWDIEQAVPGVTPDETMRAAIDVVREALEDESILVGDVVDTDEETATFIPWRVSVELAIARIEHEWLSLGRNPDPGEVAWFVDPALLPIIVNKYPLGRNWKPA